MDYMYGHFYYISISLIKLIFIKRISVFTQKTKILVYVLLMRNFYVFFDKNGLNSDEDTFYQTISIKNNGKSELVYNFVIPSLSRRVHVWQLKLVWSCVNIYEYLFRNACIYFQQMVVFLKVNFLFAVPHPPIFIHIFRSASQACIQTTNYLL